MFQPVVFPPLTLDLMKGVSLPKIYTYPDAKIEMRQGVAKLRDNTYVSVRISGVFQSKNGDYWQKAYIKSVLYETALANFPPDKWLFSDLLSECHWQQHIEEYNGYAKKTWLPVVWRVYQELGPAMDWNSKTRFSREAAWLTLARATAVAVDGRKQFRACWFSSSFSNAVNDLYPGTTWIESAQQWLAKYA